MATMAQSPLAAACTMQKVKRLRPRALALVKDAVSHLPAAGHDDRQLRLAVCADRDILDFAH
eukprot:6184286-Prymnesium_polylepis.1